ncbi:MAG: DUF192 domain-containing protein [Firmicutes bacterium]|nr:DUF192 domain-containing protein [Bacillota bacterium]
MKVINKTRGVALGQRVRKADSFWTRAKGLLGRRGLAEGEGLLLYPCRGIHSYGMWFDFDAVYLNRQYKIIHIIECLPPNRRGPMLKEAYAVLELPPGSVAATATAIGDQLVIS